MKHFDYIFIALIAIFLFLQQKTKKRFLIIALCISLFANIFLGINYYNMATTNLEKNFYPCITSLYYVLDDIDNDLFIDKKIDINNSKELGHLIYQSEKKLEPIIELMNNTAKNNSKIKINDFSFYKDYFVTCLFKLNADNRLTENEITTLKNIIHSSKNLYHYIASLPYYKKEYDSVPPIDRINEQLEEIHKMCLDGIDEIEDNHFSSTH